MSGWPVSGSGTRTRSSSRKSSGVWFENAREVVASRSVSSAPLGRSLIAIPRASRWASLEFGSPLPFEKRTSAGAGSPE